jgi:hypothetical protein
MADWLLHTLRDQTEFLEKLQAPIPSEHRQAFAHT